MPSETLVAPAGRESGGSDKPAIVLDNVVKHYGAVEAVKGVSLEIGRGEFVALIGPSGCGKTSTLRLIAGLEKPTAGDIYIDGERVNDKKPWKRDTPLERACCLRPSPKPLPQRPDCRRPHGVHCPYFNRTREARCPGRGDSTKTSS